ncbi:MAG: hypothetical protein ABW075_06230, partial [Aeromicrobium sp.]
LTYTSPVVSYVDGIFSNYAGMSMIFSAQEYPGVPQLTQDQIDVLGERRDLPGARSADRHGLPAR